MAIVEDDYVTDQAGSLSISVSASGNDRGVFVCFCEETQSPPGVSEVTFDGATMTRIESPLNEGINSATWFYILDANMPSTAGTYTLAVSGGYSNAILAWSLTGVDQSAPEDDQTTSGTSIDTLNLDITCSAGAAILATGSDGNSGRIYTWTSPMLKRNEQSMVSGESSGADNFGASTGTNNVEVTLSTTINRLLLSAISIAEAGAGGGSSVNVGIATVTDTALALSASKSKSIAIASESDTALQIVASKTVTVGVATESDQAQQLSAAKLIAIGVAIEANEALAITQGLDVAISIAVETDQALPIGRAKALLVGIASKSDQAFSISIAKSLAVGTAQELGSAIAIGKAKSIGAASEIDTAFEVVIPGVTQITVTCTLVDRNGQPLPNLASLSWAWFDATDPASFGAPTDQGDAELTDGSAELVIDLNNTSLLPGQTGTLVLRSDSGASFGAYNLEVA